MPFCNKCNRYLLFKNTTCRCRRFECCIPEWEGDDEWSDQYAADAEEAASKYTERRDECEYDCLKGPVKCRVLDPQDDSVQIFEVAAETEIHYHATQVEQ